MNHILDVMWQYAHLHWQDNVVASLIWGTGGFFVGKTFERRSIERGERHHQEIMEHVSKIHRHLGIKESV